MKISATPLLAPSTVANSERSVPNCRAARRSFPAPNAPSSAPEATDVLRDLGAMRAPQPGGVEVDPGRRRHVPCRGTPCSAGSSVPPGGSAVDLRKHVVGASEQHRAILLVLNLAGVVFPAGVSRFLLVWKLLALSDYVSKQDPRFSKKSAFVSGPTRFFRHPPSLRARRRVAPHTRRTFIPCDQNAGERAACSAASATFWPLNSSGENL